MCSEGKARGAAVLDGGDTGVLRLSGGKHPGRKYSGSKGPETEHAGLRNLHAFTAYRGWGGLIHGQVQPTEACGKTEGHRLPLKEQEGEAGALGQREQYLQTDRCEKGPVTKPARLECPVGVRTSWKG